jgi:hypothetical protein
LVVYKYNEKLFKYRLPFFYNEKGDVTMFMTFSDSSTEQMKRLKFLCGYQDYDELIKEKLKDNVIEIADLRRAVEYIKKGRKTPIKIERAKAIIKFIDDVKEKNLPTIHEEEFLKVKIFCEEFVR